MEKEYPTSYDTLLNPPKTKVHVRCPECFKLYSISTAGIQEHRPRFECKQCSTHFWIPYPECLEQEELLGFPQSWLEEEDQEIHTHLKMGMNTAFVEPEASISLEARPQEEEAQVEPVVETTAPCPKCGSENGVGAEECSACGVLIPQYKESMEDIKAGFQVSRNLRLAWKNLIDHYDQSKLHDDFIQLCKKEQALDYASYRYSRVLKACPSDEISLAQQNKVTQMMDATLNLQRTVSDKVRRRPSFKFKVSTIVVLAAVALMFLGYVVPTFRNVVGLGAALLFLAIAIRIYLRV